MYAYTDTFHEARTQAHPRRLKWAALVFLAMFSLAFPAIQVPLGFNIRLGQLILVGTFALLILRDIQSRQIAWHVILGIVGVGVLFSGISWLNVYPKVKEATFVIKFVFLYPAAFYVGMRMLALLKPTQVIAIIEITLVLGCLVAIVLHYFPVPGLIHERPAYASVHLKGSFWEQGTLAFFIGLFWIASIGLRLHYSLWPRRKGAFSAFSALALGCALATGTRTIWLALILSFVAVAFLYKDTASNEQWEKVKKYGKRWGLRCGLAAAVLVTSLAVYNAGLEPQDKLVTSEVLEHKWESERGAALRAALALIAEDPLLGKGFGFVEYYFSQRETDIIGLNDGVGAIFNCYLDIWLAVGILGPLYLLALSVISFHRASIFSILIVSYLFVRANINPITQSEYYFIFLGLSYQIARSYRQAATGAVGELRRSRQD